MQMQIARLELAEFSSQPDLVQELETPSVRF
jgi:hypothetical protein